MKIGLLVAVIGLAAVGVMQGCSTWGNGKIDPGGVELVDLTQIDVDIEWVSDDGRTFRVVKTDNGIDVQAEFVEPHTGLRFVLGEGVGAFAVRDPSTGLQMSIKRKE